LRNHGVINFPYSVPREFYGTETRDNEFVKKEVLEKFYATMVNTKSSTGERKLCVFLLLYKLNCYERECQTPFFLFLKSLGAKAKCESTAGTLLSVGWVPHFIPTSKELPRTNVACSAEMA
jgi:hypothetical protein